MAEAAIYE